MNTIQVESTIFASEIGTRGHMFKYWTIISPVLKHTCIYDLLKRSEALQHLTKVKIQMNNYIDYMIFEYVHTPFC